MTDASPRQLREKLYEHFGFRRFRPGQLEAVRSALEGHNTLVAMPTGSGKSLCYQLPGLELGGLTVVVSPLIALMKDQADGLRQRGVIALEVNSARPAVALQLAEEALAAGVVDFLFVTPERLALPEFRALLKRRRVALFVVDEAHCVSQWGHDFRPDYLTLGEAVDDLGRPPVLALTATATPDVTQDVLARLHIPGAEVVHTGFYRPNLDLCVYPAAGDGAKRAQLLRLLARCEGTGIVYVATVKAVEELTAHLTGHGIEADGYHGRLAAKKRAAAQDRFMQGGSRVMVATNAFGLGVDKPDIRFVINYHLSGSVEEYYQEFGRAGRDDRPAVCALLYDPEDLKLQRFFQGHRYPDDLDLVNAYHAVERLADGTKAPTLAELRAAAPLPPTRLKVCLALFVERDIVRRTSRGGFRLLRRGLTHDELARAGLSYRERRELDSLRQQRLVDYAEGVGCRWRRLLDHFASEEELPEGRCGHCDRCDPAKFV